MPAAIDILIEDDRWMPLKLARLAERAVAAVLADRGLSGKGYSVSILACDDAQIARLNAEFRDKPKPTNVLSWPEHDLAPLEDGGDPAAPPPANDFDDSLGDIALAWDTCAREAEETAISLPDHVTHLLIHGCLHLLGFDHERDGDAARMEALETKILASMGIEDPYRGRARD